MRLAIGIDIGGTKIAAGLVNTDDGAVLQRHQEPTSPARGGQAVLESTAAIALDLLRKRPANLPAPTSLGIGLPEIVDPKGRIHSACTFDWTTLPVLDHLSRILPTRLGADVRLAALAEARLGAGRGLDQFLYVTIGTGISSCLVIGGFPYAGNQGFAGSFASAASLIPMMDHTLQRSVSLESYASGPAIEARFSRSGNHAGSSSPQILARADQSPQSAEAQLVASAGRAIGAALAQLVNTLDPGSVILGGGLGLAGGRFHQNMLDAFSESVWHCALRNTPIRTAALGLDAGIIGSALYSSRH